MWENLTGEKLKEEFPDEFWVEFLNKVVANDVEENLFWDYKIDLSIRREMPIEAKQRQNQEILKDISAFANAESGLLIFGITDEKPRKIVGVANPERLAQTILDLVESRCENVFSIYPLIVPLKTNSGTKTCVLLLIPKTSEPIAVQDYRNNYPIYFIREGPSSRPIRNPKKVEILVNTKSEIAQNDFPVLTVVRNLLGPPAILEPFLWPKTLPKPKNPQPEWFRPLGLAKVDIEAEFIPVRTLTRLRHTIEEIWENNTVPVLKAPPASGKTSALRAISSYWQNQKSYLFHIPAIEWSREIAEAITLMAQSHKIILLIDDLHRRNEVDLSLPYFRNVLCNSNVRGLIATRPRPYLEELLESIPYKSVEIPAAYSRELICRFVTIDPSNVQKSRFDLLELLQRHQHNVASLVYELQSESSQKCYQFWQKFLIKKCRYFAEKEQTDLQCWVDLLLILSFLRTKEVNCTAIELSKFIEPDVDLSLSEIKRMLYVLEENGLVVKERNFGAESGDYRFSYHAEFCSMLLKENSEDFRRLVRRRATSSDSLRSSQLELSLWSWWIEALDPDSEQLLSIRRNLGPLWEKLRLNPEIWEKHITENPSISGVQMALLAEENESLQGNFAAWMTTQHWIAWLLNLQPDDRVLIIENWITYADQNGVTTNLTKLDLELLENAEWKEDLGTVFDPGGGGFEPANIHIGYAYHGADYVEILDELLGDHWPSLAARYLTRCIEERSSEDFKEFLKLLSVSTLESMPPNELPDALSLGKSYDSYTIKESLIHRLSLWSGPKPIEIALSVFSLFLDKLVQKSSEERILSLKYRTEAWFDLLHFDSDSNEKIKDEILELFQNRCFSDLISSDKDDEIDFLLQFLATRIPEFLERELTPDLVVDVAPKISDVSPLKNILLGHIHLIPSKTIRTWLKEDVLLARDFPAGFLEDLFIQSIDLHWFTILCDVFSLIATPLFYEGAKWETKAEALEKKKIARKVHNQLIQVMKQIFDDKWRNCFSDYLNNAVEPSTTNISHYISYKIKDVIKSAFKGEEILDITFFETWEQLLNALQQISFTESQALLLEVFLNFYPSHIPKLTQEIATDHPRVSKDILFQSLMALDDEYIAKAMPLLLRNRLPYSDLCSYSQKKTSRRLSPEKLSHLVSINGDPEGLLREFLPKFLQEPPKIASEILYWLSKKPSLEKPIIPIIQKELQIEIAVDLVKAASSRQKIHLLEFFEKAGFNLLENLDRDILVDLLVKFGFRSCRWLLQNPAIDAKVIKEYYGRERTEDSVDDPLQAIIMDLRIWSEAGRDSEIFLRGVSNYLTPELLDGNKVLYVPKEIFGQIISYDPSLAATVRNLTKYWLTDSNVSWNENALEAIRQAWGYPETLKQEIAKWEEEEQKASLQKIIGFEKLVPKHIIDTDLDKDWNVSLFSRTMRISSYQEIVQWILFDQNELGLEVVKNLVSFDSTIIEACSNISEEDWTLGVFGAETTFFCSLLEILANLTQVSSNRGFLETGQRILDEEKNPKILQSFLLEKEKSSNRFLQTFKWNIAFQNLQSEPARFLRLYHDLLYLENGDNFQKVARSTFSQKSLDELSWTQVMLFLVSLPEAHSSSLVEFLQQKLVEVLESTIIYNIFRLQAILALPHQERRKFYDQISPQLLAEINWWSFQHEITDAHCGEQIERYQSSRIPLAHHLDYYRYSSMQEDKYCAICELPFIRRDLVREFWENLIYWVAEKACVAAHSLPIEFLMDFYEESSTLRLWIEQDYALRDRLFTFFSTPLESPQEDISRFRSRRKNPFISIFRSPFADELWKLLGKHHYETLIRALINVYSLEELSKFFLDQLPLLSDSDTFFAEILSVPEDVPTKSHIYDFSESFLAEDALHRLWIGDPKSGIAFLEAFQRIWPKWFSILLSLITPDKVYRQRSREHKDIRAYFDDFVWWLGEHDWPYATHYAELLLYCSENLRLGQNLSKKEELFIETYSGNLNRPGNKLIS